MVDNSIQIEKNKPALEKWVQVETTVKERIHAFDLARGIAIILMVAIHTIVFLGNPGLVTSIPGYIANSIICILAAPVFTFIMGIMIAFSSRSSTRQLLYRGILLLIAGYILNLFRGTVPMAVAEWLEWVDIQEERPWMYLLEEDILQFAGISFIIIGLLKRIIPWKKALTIAGFAVMFIAPLLWKIQDVEGVPGYLMSLLFGGSHYNFFPIIPWIAFPLIGMGYGELLKQSKDKNKFFMISIIVGALMIVFGFSVVSSFETSLYEQWYKGVFRQGKLPPLVSVIFTGFLFVWVPVCYFITKKVKNSRFFDFLYFWSKNVTWFYAIQWLIIGWACTFLPYLSWWQVIVVIITTIILTDRIMISFVKKTSNN